MVNKKDYFQRKSASKIMAEKDIETLVRAEEIADAIDSLKDNQVLIAVCNIIPERFYPYTFDSNGQKREPAPMSRFRNEAAGNFLKHGKPENEVRLRQQYNIEQMVQERKIPLNFRSDAFSDLKHPFYSCYSFMPLIGKDKKRRKVRLRECLEGTKLFKYSLQNPRTEITVANYGTPERARRVEVEGSTIICGVPSRTPKHDRYKVKLMNVQTQDTPNKFAYWRNILGTEHDCDFLINEIGYNYLDDRESSEVLYFDAHHVAAYLRFAQKILSEDKNIVPLQMCPFAIPTEETMKFYEKAKNQAVVMYLDERGKPKYAPLNIAELEIALWAKVLKDGHDNTFFARKKIAQYVL